MDAPELLPCPFCGCTTIKQIHDAELVFHRCDWCGAEGPAEEPHADPPQGWSYRADLSAAAIADAYARGLRDAAEAYAAHESIQLDRWKNVPSSWRHDVHEAILALIPKGDAT